MKLSKDLEFQISYTIGGSKLKKGDETLESLLDKALKGKLYETGLLNSCTNEIGFELGVAATEVLGIQLRKFIALNAFRELYHRDKNTSNTNYYAANGEIYYESVMF